MYVSSYLLHLFAVAWRCCMVVIVFWNSSTEITCRCFPFITLSLNTRFFFKWIYSFGLIERTCKYHPCSCTSWRKSVNALLRIVEVFNFFDFYGHISQHFFTAEAFSCTLYSVMAKIAFRFAHFPQRFKEKWPSFSVQVKCTLVLFTVW